MRDAHLLGLALVAALAPACQKSPPDAGTPPDAVSTTTPDTTEPPDVVTSGGRVTDPDPVANAPTADCTDAGLPEPTNLHTIRYADGSSEPVDQLNAASWQAAKERLIKECKALGDKASCPDDLLLPAELLCRAQGYKPTNKSSCSSTLYNQPIFTKGGEGLAWQLSCDWVIIQVDPWTGEALSRSEIIEGRPLTDGHEHLVPEVHGAQDAVARYWLDMAAAELASVHSFERHALELRSLGAPEELVQAAIEAAQDEARHAALCLQLAGHGALGAMPASPPPREGAAEILRGVVLEGCVNETVSALLARRAASTCADPVRAAMLGSIADDEQAHAALAWRTLAWALRRHPELRGELERAMQEASRRLEVRPSEACGDGLLSAEAREQCIRDALDGAVGPAWAACASGLVGSNVEQTVLTRKTEIYAV